MWLKTGTLAFGLVAILGSVTTYLSSKLTGDDTQSVMTHSVQRGNLSVTVTENGTLESSNNKEIKCFVKGGSTVLWVIETGTMVKPDDELVRLDTSLIEENITQQEIAYERAIANQIIAQSDVNVAETNVEEYINGTYLEERQTIEKNIFDAEEVVKKAQLAYESALRMAAKGLFRTLQLEGEKFAVDSAVKDLEMKKTQLVTLDNYKKKKSVQEFKSALEAAKARLAAEEASLRLEKDRLDRDREQLANCVITSAAAGMVIFPSAAEWKDTPDIEEGAVVREQQTLLMIPDLTKMQVKVGIHESKVDRIKVGMPATVRLQEEVLQGTVDSIAEVTRPAGWWTGNMVKYDTIIKLESRPGLKPGMSVVVDVVLADHQDILKVPVAAIVQSNNEYLCWVKTQQGIKQRSIQLGDTNDEFTIVTAGLKEGDDVVLNPLAFVDEAQSLVIRPADPSAADSNKEVADTSKPESAKPVADAQKETAAGA